MPQRRPASAEPGLQLRSFKPARPMAQQLAADLLGLSPKLQQVAQYCLQHARHLHLCRIQDVAGHCNTQPVTVVRLAKRYGFRGFLDFKMAFLAETQADPAAIESGASPAQRLQPAQHQSATDALGAVLGHHARATLEQQRLGLQQLELDWSGQAFCKAVTLLKRARRVWLHGSPAAMPMAACYAELLRAAGLSLQWIRPPTPETGSMRAVQSGTAQPAGGLCAHDVLLSLSLASDDEADLDAVYIAQRMGVAVLAITDQQHGSLARTADAHLYVAALGAGLQGLGAAMVLAHTLR